MSPIITGIGIGIGFDGEAGVGGGGSGSNGDLVDENFDTSPGWTFGGVGTITQNTGRVVATAQSGTGPYIFPPTFAESEEYWVDFDLTLQTGFNISSAAQQVTAFRLDAAGDYRLAVDVLWFNSIYTIQLRIKRDGGNATFTEIAGPSIIKGTTYKITAQQVHSTGISANDGIGRLWVDTDLIHEGTTIDDFNTTRADGLSTGARTGGSTVSGKLEIDNIRVGTGGSPPD